jgi:hypothetical protein
LHFLFFFPIHPNRPYVQDIKNAVGEPKEIENNFAQMAYHLESLGDALPVYRVSTGLVPTHNFLTLHGHWYVLYFLSIYWIDSISIQYPHKSCSNNGPTGGLR